MLDPTQMIQEAKESSERIAKIQAVATIVAGMLPLYRDFLGKKHTIVEDAIEIYETIANQV